MAASLAEAGLVNKMSDDEHDLRTPRTPEEWDQYHAIRRRVLWESRGYYGVYDANRPDEYKSGHHPFLLMHRGVPVGVVRIDIDGRQAILRRVAIREDMQRAGHGRVLLGLAEKFASENGCELLYSFVSPDAVGFYEKCGFQRDAANAAGPSNVPMEKRVSGRMHQELP